jgi:hypothetical protein
MKLILVILLSSVFLICTQAYNLDFEGIAKTAAERLVKDDISRIIKEKSANQTDFSNHINNVFHSRSKNVANTGSSLKNKLHVFLTDKDSKVSSIRN